MAAVTALGVTFDTTTGSHTVTATPAINDLIVIVCANTGITAAPTVSDNNADGLGAYTNIVGALKNTSTDKAFIFIRNALVVREIQVRFVGRFLRARLPNVLAQ